MYRLENGTEIRTSLKEMNIKEFEKISDIMNDNTKLSIEKYIDILEALGTPEEVINQITDDELFAIIKDFGNYEYEDTLPQAVQAEDGYYYEAYPIGGEFVLKAIDMAKIEKAFKSSKDTFSTIVATVFKRSDLTNKEHYADAHIKHKKSIVKNWNAAHFYPYIVYLTKKVNANLSKKIEETNEPI